MPTTLIPAPTTTVTTQRRLVLTNPADVQHAADALAGGGVVGHGFANISVITSRPDPDIVRQVNVLTGQPADQLGSITVPPDRLPDLYDWTQLPPGLTKRSVLRVVDAFCGSGPFGFRGPAADLVPDHLTQLDGDVVITDVLVPGYDCPSNDFLAHALAATDDCVLHVTYASPSHRGAATEDSGPRFTLLEHADEQDAHHRYAGYQATPPTILSFHRPLIVRDDRRPHLMLERSGSLHVEAVRTTLDELGFGLVISPEADNRLLRQDYAA
jgi:hypothetical protein